MLAVSVLLQQWCLFLCFNCARYAFLTFGSRPRMLEAFNRYSSCRLVADGQIVHLIKYEPPKNIPCGTYIWRSISANRTPIFLLLLVSIAIHSCCTFLLCKERVHCQLYSMSVKSWILLQKIIYQFSILPFSSVILFHYNKYWSSRRDFVNHSSVIFIFHYSFDCACLSPLNF